MVFKRLFTTFCKKILKFLFQVPTPNLMVDYA